MNTAGPVTPYFPPELHDLKRRIVEVPEWGSYEVCEYVARVDIDRGRVGTHGWQIRYQGQSQYFSDSLRDQPGTPRSSLDKALAGLAAIYQGPQPTVVSRGNTKSGMPAGLRLLQKRAPGKEVDEFHVEAIHPVRAKESRRFYCGTENTITEERFDKACEEALACRAAWLAEIDAARRDAYENKLRVLRMSAPKPLKPRR